MTIKRKSAAVVALAAAGLALTACGTDPVEKPWPSATESPAVSAAAAESTAPAAPRFEWVDVTGQGIELPRDVREHTMYSPQPVPGAKILHVVNAADDMNACSIGPAVIGTQGRGFLTGAACTGDFGRPLQYLQTLPGGGIQGWAEAVSPGADASVIWSSRSAANVTRIAGTWPIAGLLTAEGAHQLVPVGSPVCIFGATSGVACGAKLPDAKGLLQFDIPSVGQDTGAPAFVVDRATGNAVLLGIYRRGAGVAALDATLGRLGAKVLIDPGAKSLTGEYFSDFVTEGN